MQLGLTAEAASSFLLPQLIGHRRAADMLMAGNAIDAETALSWGLVNKVDNNPEQCAAETAQQLAKLPSRALQQNKALMKAAFESSAREANRREVVAFTEALQSEEAKQAFKRFLS